MVWFELLYVNVYKEILDKNVNTNSFCCMKVIRQVVNRTFVSLPERLVMTHKDSVDCFTTHFMKL